MAARTALVVVDMQKAFDDASYWGRRNNPDCERNVAHLRDRRDFHLVVDVREPWETEICRIDGAQLIPMNSLPQRLQELPRDRTIAVVCHAGQRSYYAAAWLLAQGFEAVSVAGGVNAWPGMKRY